MSEPVRVCLVGATGLTGRALIEEAVGRGDLRIIAMARREMKLPQGSRMVMVVSESAGWPEIIASSKASVLVCALGTTWRKAGKDQAAFRAVDFDMAVACAKAAKSAGIEHMIVISSVGANAAARSYYLRVKGEMEMALGKVGFRRLDILRPGLLLGTRIDDRRPAERVAAIFSPLFDRLLHGKYRQFRSIAAGKVARTIFALVKERAAGRFVHDNDAMHRVLRRHGG
jgi:uncharacterized protein YbjT (DUF2867 family)